MEQIVLNANDNYKSLKNYLTENDINNLFIVCSKNISRYNISNFLDTLFNIKKTYFTDFKPNPDYESVVDGVKKFKSSKSKHILAIGGGSAIDVAKAIKLFSSMDDNSNYLNEDFQNNDVELMVVPTTAGTGSEATKYSVIYKNGIKQSVTHESLIPKVILFDPSFLTTLPEYQKKATSLDALSHSFESYWSVNSSDISKIYSKEAIALIQDNLFSYLNGNDVTSSKMLYASYLAGKAINISQTTAGHALCYKLTSLYGISHGHAAALVNSSLIPFMLDNMDKSVDPRGVNYVQSTFAELEQIAGQPLVSYFENLLDSLNLYNVDLNRDDLNKLTESVNLTRLKNNPIELSKDDIYYIYEDLFNKVEKRRNKNGSQRFS